MKTDLLFALRSLRRAPGFFFLAVATLGLGIASNTAIFSLFYQVLLRSLPVRQPEQLVVLHYDPPYLPGSASSDNNERVFSYPLYQQLRDSKSLQGLAVRSGFSVQVLAGGAPERGGAEVVSGNFFDVLGVSAQTGRLLSPSDDATIGTSPVAVLSHDFWVRRFGAAKSIVNQNIRLDGLPFTVIGIAPEGFRGVLAGSSPDVYVPISMWTVLNPGREFYDKPDNQFLTIIGRLAPGVSRERAMTELQPRFTAAVLDELQRTSPKNRVARERFSTKRLELHAASQGLNTLEQDWKKPLFVLLAMVLLLLVIACANLANLLMARAVNRAREISIRLALGAGRLRVIRLLFIESAVLAVIGTLLGLLLAPALTDGIIRLLPSDILSGWLGGRLNLPILGFSIVLMFAATLLFGIIPAVQATSGASSPLGERSQTSGGTVHSRSRKVLVAGQLALSLVLLCTAGLFGRSLANLLQHQPGFRVDHLIAFSVDAGLGGYDTERGMGLYRELTRKLAAIPGVEAVSMAQSAPLSGSDSNSNVSVEGYTQRDDNEMMSSLNEVGPGYFHTVGTTVLEGREFDDRDRVGAPKVVVVNQAFVRHFFGNRSAIGRKMEAGAGRPLDLEIVGVVADSDNLSLRETVKPTYFLPYEQSLQKSPRIQGATFFVRADRGFDSLSGAIRGAMTQLDPSLPVFGLNPMEKHVKDVTYTDRLIAALSAAFGVLALLLTAVGLYGVIAYVVSRRTAEIGIRMVLGAEPLSILRMILSEVGLLVLVGATAGILGAIAAGRAVESQLYGVPGLDPVVMVTAVVVLSLVALTAASVPAVRAARIQPLEALRHD